MTFNIELHPGDEYISNYIRKYNCWEPITTAVLNEILEVRQPNTVFVDIGANIGYFTLIAAIKGVPVIAFEPIAANYELLTKSILNNNLQNLVSAHMISLSDKQEKIIINVSTQNMGLCSTRNLEQYSYSQTSETSLLDEYFGEKTSNNLIIKIDVEEQEKKVLYGMEKTLSSGKVSHIIIEISNYDPDIFAFLRYHGYNYAVSIGFDDEKNEFFTTKTHYLKEEKYLGTLDNLEKDMINDKNEVNKQKMVLLYKTPFPI